MATRICTLSVQLYSYVTSVNSFMCPTELLIIVIIKSLSYSEISLILCSLFSVFTLFYLILETCQLMGENVVFLVIFDTCDVMYNWSISQLTPIVLDNLFDVGLPFSLYLLGVDFDHI